ncbi:MAG: hypothetical protein OQK53_07685 [Rhodospirillales bacterium]|nr:hypothetical protein [Rhodospirillales bacterium]
MNPLKIHKVSFAAAAITIALATGAPAHAEDNSCPTLVTKSADVGKTFLEVKTSLSALESSLRYLEETAHAMIEADRVLEDGIEMTDYVIKTSSEAATITEVIPAVHGPLNTIKEVLQKIKKYGLEQVEKVLHTAVVSTQLKKRLPLISKTANKLEAFDKEIATAATFIEGYKIVVQKACKSAEQSSDANCRAETERTARASLGRMTEVENNVHPVRHSIHELESVVRHELLPAIKPFKSMERPIHHVHEALKDVHRAIKDFEHALHHTIHIKAAGVTVATFSVHEVLHNWEKTVHKLEHDLHITEAKKWLEKEISKILHPIIKDALKPVRRIEHEIKLEAREFGKEAAAAFERFEQQAAGELDISQLTAGFDGDIGTFKKLTTQCSAQSTR